ncbi:TrkH family potassium uptake protein [Thalassiella azotivora]
MASDQARPAGAVPGLPVRRTAPPGPPAPRGRGLRHFRDVVDEAARRSPARLALGVFAAVVLLFTGLLLLPVATVDPGAASLADALFTATSAVCVTGLVTVDTAAYWSPFGQVVILVGIKVGGLGILTLASLLGLAVSRRLGLRQRLIAANETKAMRLGEVGTLLRTIVLVSTTCELVITAVLFPRFLLLGESVGNAAWHALFYGISAFNNAGFLSHEGGLPGEPSSDWWLSLPIALGVFVGSFGFPVLLVLVRRWRRPSTWDLHTRLTLWTTSILFGVTVLAFAVFEWTNPATLGPLSGGDRLLTVVFSSVMPRSGGFSVVDVGEMRETTWFVTDALMFVGGGSASTAGGIKVTTLAVLVLAAVAEARGDRDVETNRRRIPQATLRLAVTVTLAGSALVAVGTLALLAITGLSLDVVLFESISAFATVGLSTGITSGLPDEGKFVLSALMFLGRTGTITLAAALALREKSKMFRLPEERPIVG